VQFLTINEDADLLWFTVKCAVICIAIYGLVKGYAKLSIKHSKAIGKRRKEMENEIHEYTDDDLAMALRNSQDLLRLMAALNVAADRMGTSPAVYRAVVELDSHSQPLVRMKVAELVSKRDK